jgi:hypothetical protein
VIDQPVSAPVSSIVACSCGGCRNATATVPQATDKGEIGLSHPYPASLTFARDANQAEKPAAGSSPNPKWLASREDPSPQETKKGRTLRPAPASLFCSDGLRIRNPCRPYRPSHHHPASQVPSSPASRRPSPRWSPAGRRPRPHPAAPSAPPWSGQQCRPSLGP